MTERGLPLVDGAPACPFVAFDDDRDERGSAPDHRHRCFADNPPAPRALAHQEAYCLSSAFPVCPTFQDWARREAARSRSGASTAASASTSAAAAHRAASEQALAMAAAEAAAVVRGAGDEDDDEVGAPAAAATAPVVARDDGDDVDDGDDADDGDAADRAVRDDDRSDDLVRRNPPRDWAAPPPWLASSEGRTGDPAAEPPPFLGRRSAEPGQGLAGSSADWLAGGPPPARRPTHDDDDDIWSSDSRSAAAAGAGLERPSERGRPRRPSEDDEDFEGHDEPGEPRRPGRRPRAYAQHLGGPDGPDWERPRRYEAYPQIRSRVELPRVSRTVGMAVIVGLLALALFFLPGILNLGGRGGGGPVASASPSVAAEASQSVAPTVPPDPTPSVYTIKKGDTLSKVAKAHGVTLDELLAANPSIKNPNKISEGQQIIIPLPSEAPPDEVGASTAP